MIIARTYFSILLGRISGGTSLPASKHDIHQQRRDPWWLQYVYDEYGQVKRNIFSAAPPGAGAAGAALAGLLAGLVPGEKLAMGCWMLVAQAAPTVGESQDFKSVLARLFGIPRNRMVAGLERHILYIKVKPCFLDNHISIYFQISTNLCWNPWWSNHFKTPYFSWWFPPRSIA